jgi:hypothetical protein
MFACEDKLTSAEGYRIYKTLFTIIKIKHTEIQPRGERKINEINSTQQKPADKLTR